MPLHRDLHTPVDYSSVLLGECVLRRLFTDVGTARGAALDARCLDDGRQWQITLDDELTWSDGWSDGDALHADDAARGFLGSLERRSNGATMFASMPSGDGGSPARVLGKSVVEYRFDRPVGFARELLSQPQFAPRRNGFDGSGRELSLGAYSVSHWSPDAVTLTANRSSSDVPDSVRFVHVAQAAHAVELYERGELDATSPTGFGLEQVRALSGRPDAVVTPIDIFGTLDFGRLAPRGWLSSADARRTLSTVLNRAELEVCTSGLVIPWRWPGSAALGEGAPEGTAAPQDLEALRRAVDGPLDIAFSDFDPNAEIALELAGQLERTLGVPVSTTRLSFDAYVRAAARHDHCLLFALTMPAFSHPAGSLSDWRSTGRSARQHGVADSVLDSRLDDAESCLDAGGAGHLWERVVTRWSEILPKIPVARVCAWFLRGKGKEIVRVTPSGLLLFGQESSA